MKRPQNHILEDISINYFKLNIPENWIFYEYNRDYGIDGQIEIFENNESTSLRCYVQLKATDSSDKPYFYIDKEHFVYWNMHSDPTLIVYFENCTKTLKWCWSHDVGLYDDNQNCNIVPYLKKWDIDDTPKYIKKFLETRREIYLNDFHAPIYILLKCELGLAIELRKKLINILGNDFIRILFSIEQLYQVNSPVIEFNIVNDEIMLSISDVKSLPIKIDNEQINIENAILYALWHLSSKLKISWLAKLISDKIVLDKIPHYLIPDLLGLIIQNNGYKKAVELILSIDDEILKNKCIILMNIFSFKMNELKFEWGEILKILADELYLNEFDNNAYNYARYLQQENKYKDSIRYFELAGVRNSNYLERNYFYSDFAVSYFEMKQYNEAIKLYKKSLELEYDAEVEWRLADCLWRIGKFKEALDILNKIKIENSSRFEYLFLIRNLCFFITEVYHIFNTKLHEFSNQEYEVMRNYFSNDDHNRTDKIIFNYLNLNVIDPRG